MQLLESLSQPLTRESLYEAVWRTPMRSLAFRFGCSDRGLAKLCERFQIPVPPRGYWAKLAAGHRVHPPPLPTLSQDELRILGPLDPPEPQPRTPVPDLVTAAVAKEAKKTEQQINVRDNLGGAHPLVSKTRDLFASAYTDERGILHPDGGSQERSGALAIHVSKASVHRALLIADALLRALEAKGWTVCCPAKSERRGTGIGLLGEEIAISIEEKAQRFEHPKKPRRVTKGHSYDTGRGPYTTIMEDPYPRHGYKSLGQLSVRVPGYGSPKFQIADGVKRHLEDRLDEVVVGIVRVAEQYRDWRRERDERERVRLEEQRRRDELERQRAMEATRIAVFEQEMASWRKAEDIRAYVAAVRSIEREMSEERQERLAWALQLADRIDPIKRGAVGG